MAAGKQCFLHFRPTISLATLMLSKPPPPPKKKPDDCATALLEFYLRPLPNDYTEHVCCSISVCLDRFLKEIPDFMNLDKSESQ
jgi:hypothetical protein